MDGAVSGAIAHAGQTLLELLVTLLIGSTVLVAGIPLLSSLVLDARRTADVNALVRAVQLARSEAAKRQASVAVCPSLDGTLCSDTESGFDRGWIVIADPWPAVDAGPAADMGSAADAAGEVLSSYSARIRGSIRSNRSIFHFRPNLRRSSNGTVTFCDARGPSGARAVIVSYTGRPRVADAGPGGRPLECPAH